MIFTSGTMSPLDSWEKDLNIEAPIHLSNKHVISPQQIRLNIIKNSIDNTLFKFTHNIIESTDDKLYYNFVESLIVLEKKIPNGILIVCPNFKTLRKLKLIFQDKHYKSRIAKSLVYEQR